MFKLRALYQGRVESLSTWAKTEKLMSLLVWLKDQSHLSGCLPLFPDCIFRTAQVEKCWVPHWNLSISNDAPSLHQEIKKTANKPPRLLFPEHRAAVIVSKMMALVNLESEYMLKPKKGTKKKNRLWENEKVLKQSIFGFLIRDKRKRFCRWKHT